LGQCTRSANHTKIITRHIWQDSKNRVDAHRLTENGKRLYARRKETVERSFADAKEIHGHRWAKRRGLPEVHEQSLLCATVQNIKKIALHLWDTGGNRHPQVLSAIYSALRHFELVLVPSKSIFQPTPTF